MLKILIAKQYDITTLTKILKDKLSKPNAVITVSVSNNTTAVIRNFNNEWFFVENTPFPFASDDNLEKISEFLINYETKLAERNEDIKRLEQLKCQIETMTEGSTEWNEAMQSFSDSYKSIYGKRPH